MHKIAHKIAWREPKPVELRPKLFRGLSNSLPQCGCGGCGTAAASEASATHTVSRAITTNRLRSRRVDRRVHLASHAVASITVSLRVDRSSAFT